MAIRAHGTTYPIRLVVVRKLLGWLGAVGIATWLHACGSQGSRSRALSPAPATSASAAGEVSAHTELVHLLGSLPRAGALWSRVPPGLRKDADTVLSRLDATERGRLLDSTSNEARTRPLLHLAAGGNSADAWLALATGQAPSELLFLRRAKGGSHLDEVVVGARALAENAALTWLGDESFTLSSPSAFTAELGDQVADLGMVLERSDLVLLAARAAAEAHGDERRWLRVAAAAARALDVPLAERALRQASIAATDPDVPASLRTDVRQRVAQARKVATAPKRCETRAASDAVDLARAWTGIGRTHETLAFLEPCRALFGQHLGLTAAWAIGRLEGSICPGLPLNTTAPELCAAAWRRRPETGEVVDLLERAWQSRAGRDCQSVEEYLGIAHVVPWIYSLLGRTETSSDGADRFAERLDGLRAAASEAASELPSFRGIALFVDLLHAGFRAARSSPPAPRVSLPAAAAESFWSRATDLAHADGQHPANQGAVMAVASVLMQDRDPLPLLEALPATVLPEYRRTRALLRAFSAVGSQRWDLAENAREDLLASLPPEGNPGRSQAVLLLAEVDAVLRRRPEDLVVLERITQPLLDDRVPLTLRLEAAVDRAGTLARRGQLGPAAAVLDPFTSPEPGSPGAGDLLAIARVYRAMLLARATPGPERKRRFAEFEQSHRSAADGNLPPGARVWSELWRHQLGRELGARNPPRAPDSAERARRMGVQAARLLAAGALPVGSVENHLNYSLTQGLMPVVNLELRLLVVDLPQAAGDFGHQPAGLADPAGTSGPKGP
jgi:hypothetical protein